MSLLSVEGTALYSKTSYQQHAVIKLPFYRYKETRFFN